MQRPLPVCAAASNDFARPIRLWQTFAARPILAVIEGRTRRVARRRLFKTARKSRSPGDYETELVRLCKGNRRLAEQLLAEQCEKSPGMSRQGAALAVVTRLRHEKKPVKASL
jgi:hypothetical protein